MQRWFQRTLTGSVFLVQVGFSFQGLALSSQDLSAQLSQPAGRLALLAIGGGIVYDTQSMRTLYQARQDEPLWLGSEENHRRLEVMREILLKAFQHGLETKTFWSDEMENFYARGEGMNEMDFELGVTEAALRYATTLFRGQVDPALVDDDIKLKIKDFGIKETEALRGALDGAPEKLAQSLAQFESQIPLYQQLKKHLTTVNATLTPEQRAKIQASMEKLRWLPRDLGSRYAFVNLAMTEMKVIENGQPSLLMKTVNGRPIRRTPMMIDKMVRVELNPTWTVPFNLAIWDKLPRIKQDVGFLSRMGLEVFRPGSDTPIEDVSSIPWRSFSRGNFPYILRQKAGPSNVLGKVKFPLTNGYSIYLHDTDERNLFNGPAPRLRSSGCIRLQKPMEMAALLLKSQKVPNGRGWVQADGSEYPEGTLFTEDILMTRVAKSGAPSATIRTVGITLENPLTLYTAYLTADTDDGGEIRFVDDAYRQDERLLTILRSPGAGRPLTPPLVEVKNARRVPFMLSGSTGPTQLFGRVVAIRCAVMPYKGCVEFTSSGKQWREEYVFKLNELVQLPEGHYIVGYENSMLPGWLKLKCKKEGAGGCQPITQTLERIDVPESMAQAAEVLIYRDISTKVEGNKILSQAFHNGRALIQQTPFGPRDFYLPGINQLDVVQGLTNDFCVPILRGKVKDVAPEVLSYCRAMDRVEGMADYVDLPVVIANETVVGNSEQVKANRKLKVFEFPSNSDKARLQNQWNQRWVGAPGNWIDFTHRRYLVAAPLHPQNLQPEERFASVLPGRYIILALDGEGRTLAQQSIQTANIDENYERIEREVFFGE